MIAVKDVLQESNDGKGFWSDNEEDFEAWLKAHCEATGVKYIAPQGKTAVDMTNYWGRKRQGKPPYDADKERAAAQERVRKLRNWVF